MLQHVIEELGAAQRGGDGTAVTAQRLRADVERQLDALSALG